MYSKGKHGCPRGFKWCDKKEECIPEGTEASDKLKIEYQRYFFKEGNTMDNIDKLVDEVFSGGFHTFGRVRKAEKKIDMLLDNVDLGKGSINTTGRPYDHPIKMKVVTTPDGKAEINIDDNVAATVEGGTLEECGMGPMMNEDDGFADSEYDEGPAKEDDPKKVSNDINHVPNQKVGGLLKSVHDELSEATVWQMVAEMRKDVRYKRFFVSMMKENGFSSLDELPVEFVDAVNNAWNEAWQHPIRRGGGSAYGSQAGGGQTRGGFGSIRGSSAPSPRSGGYGMIKGKNEQEDEEDIEGIEEE